MNWMFEQLEARRNQEIMDGARNEAEAMSKTHLIAYVYRLRSGRVLVTSSERHMIPGTVLETYSSGKRLNI